MSNAAYQVLVYAARYWFAALAIFIVWRAGQNSLREFRIVRDIRRRIDEVSTFAELVVIADDSGRLAKEETFPFAGEAVLGSGANCDVRIRHRDIARRHLRLTAQDDCVRIRPIRTKKARALLDGQEIERETLAFDGSELRLGAAAFRLRTREAFDAQA